MFPEQVKDQPRTVSRTLGYCFDVRQPSWRTAAAIEDGVVPKLQAHCGWAAIDLPRLFCRPGLAGCERWLV